MYHIFEQYRAEIINITIMLFILFGIGKKKRTELKATIFYRIIICVVALCITALIGKLCEDSVITLPDSVIYFLCQLYFISISMCSISWIMYELAVLRKDQPTSNKGRWVIAVPFLVMTFLLLPTQWTHLVFYISEGHMIKCGLWGIQYVILGAYIIYYAVILIYQLVKNPAWNPYVRGLTVFLFIVLLFIILQYRHGGTNICTLFGLSVFYSYIELYTVDIFKLEKAQLEHDALLSQAENSKMLTMVNSELSSAQRSLKKSLELSNRQLNIIRSMTSFYYCVYVIDLEKNEAQQLSDNAGIQDLSSGIINASELFDIMCRELPLPEFKEGVCEFLELSTIQERLRNKLVITTEFRSESSGWSQAYFVAGEKNEDGSLQTVQFALRSINDEKEKQYSMQKEMRQQYAIVSALSREFQDVFLMDLDADTSVTLKLNGKVLDKDQRGARKYDATWDYYIKKYVHPDDADITRSVVDSRNVKRMLAERDEYIHMYRIILPDGVHSYQATFRLLFVDNTKQIIVGFRNIDDIIREEQQKQQVLEKALEDSKRANAAKTSFLNNMSHDIRTPMNAIMGFTELLSIHGDNKELRERYLQSIRVSEEHLLNLINNVLEMSRIESGSEIVNDELTDIELLFKNAGIIFDNEYKKHDFTVKRDFNIAHRYCIVDRTKVNEIFMNIISNSIKYTRRGGTISISVSETDSAEPGIANYKTVISDTGIGMSKEFLPHIFDSFSREKNTTESSIPGTGLGMGIVKHLVELLNGTIEVESELGKGTAITVIIPARIVEDCEPIEQLSTEAAPERLMGKRVLLAEDNALNAEIAMELFSENGFLIERAVNGEVCVEMIAGAPNGYYDFIMMDVQMPGMNGLEATRAIRALDDEAKASIPIIAMTANAFDQDRKQALEAGMNGFVTKPIDIGVLVRTISSVVK